MLEVDRIEPGSLQIRLAPGVELQDSTPMLYDGGTLPAAILMGSGAFSGEHDVGGVIVLAGPGIKKDFALTGASVLDVAPTLLALAAEPVPQGLDGRVLVDALDPLWLARHPLASQPPLPEREKSPTAPVPDNEVEEQLRALGYVK